MASICSYRLKSLIAWITFSLVTFDIYIQVLAAFLSSLSNEKVKGINRNDAIMDIPMQLVEISSTVNE